MKKLTIKNRANKEILVNPAISLLQLLGQNGVDIFTKCGGRARCGMCKFTILSGDQFFSEETVFEQHYKTTNPLPDNVRLACQTHLRGDAEIWIGIAPNEQEK